MDFEKIKAPLWGAVGGAIVLAAVGFTWGGWITPSKAAHMSEEAAGVAVLARLTPICVSQFGQDAEKVKKLEILKDLNSWDRSDYVAKQGWSMIPGEKETDSKVSRDCASVLVEMKG